MRAIAVLLAGAMTVGLGAEAHAGLFGSKKLDNCPVIKYVLRNCKLARKSGVRQILGAVKNAKSAKTAKASKRQEK